MRTVSALVLLSLLSACGGNDAAEAEGNSGELQPVRGDLDITSIVVSQSVVQTIYLDGEVVSPTEYVVPLIPNRTLWVRAMWDPPLDWTPRPLIARLHLEYEDGEEEVILEDEESAKGTPPMVVGKSDLLDMQSSFYWRLKPEDVVPGMRYSVTVVEPEPANDIPASTGKTRWPRENNTALPISPDPSRLSLYLVGVRYDIPGCSTDTTVLSEDEYEAIRRGFEVWSAVETGSVTLDTSLSVDITTPTDPFGLLEVVGSVRAQYPEIIDAFFYILMDDCSAVPNGVLGVAPVNSDPPQPGESSMRYGAGLWHHNDITESVNTAVHEIGHSQGALHAPCGGADGPDPEFPHAEARIGSLGQDPFSLQFYDPSQYADFMSYCRPYWVSDYRFRKNYNTQRILTAYASSAPPSVTPDREGTMMLAGIVQESGEARWWVYENRMPPPISRAGELSLDLHTPAGKLALPADSRLLPELPGARLVQVPLDSVGVTDIAEIQAIEVHGVIELSVAAPRITDRRAITVRRR